jgi:hypothetical protein
MPEPEEDVKPVSAAKPRDDVYTVLQVLATAVFITAIVLVLMELQDPANFGRKLFGQQ